MTFIKTHRKYLLASGIIWAACFVIFMLAYMLIVRPQKISTKLIEDKLAEKKQLYKSALNAAREETRVQLKEQIESLKNRLKDFVVDFEDSANLTFDLSQIAEEKRIASFGSKVKNNRGLMTNVDYKYIRENHINISFIGDFIQFATFLNTLERHRPVIFVDKFTITRSGREDSGYQISLNVTAFVKKQQDSKTADEGPTQVYGKKI